MDTRTKITERLTAAEKRGRFVMMMMMMVIVVCAVLVVQGDGPEDID